MSVFVKGMPPTLGDNPAIRQIAGMGHYSLQSDTTIDTTATSWTLFNVPANVVIEAVSLEVTTAFTSTGGAGLAVRLGDTPGGRQFGVFGLGTLGTLGTYKKPVGAEYDTPVVIYGTLLAGGSTAATGAANVWLTYRPNSNEQKWSNVK